MYGGSWRWHGEWDGGWDQWQRSGGCWRAHDAPSAAAVADNAPAWHGGGGRADGRADGGVDGAPNLPDGVAIAPNLPAPDGALTLPAAVADANVGPARIYDLDYFQGLADDGFTDHYKQHNIALKWFREIGERHNRDEVRFNNDGPEWVPEIQHPAGMNFSFPDERKTNPWRWQTMVAQLALGDMQRVVCGEDRSRGLVGCRLAKANQYDHKRSHARFETTGEKRWSEVWDFVLDRSDGTCVSLHPHFKGTSVSMREGLPEPSHTMPKGGPGTSEGPGTYKHYKNKHVQATLRFDPSRILAKGSGKGRSP
jgi:hypothetical protein